MAVPDPEPGLVVHFDYLWSRERGKGLDEARYPRPCAVVLSYRRSKDGSLIVLLAPITHTEPGLGDAAVEVPPAVKTHLGLDEARSWVMLDEVNETGWPGYDLRPKPDGEYAYGFLPPRLYRRIKARLIETIQARLLRRISR